MIISMNHHALLVKHFYKNSDSAPKALKFPILKGMKKGIGPMTVVGLKKIIQKEELSGNVQSCCAWGIARILDTCEHGAKNSTRHPVLLSIQN